MKNLILFFFFIILTSSCKKEETVINGTNQLEFEKSTELIERELNSSLQPKLNEAIKLIWLYETQMDNDTLRWSRTRQLLNSKNADFIFNLAEKTALKKGINWSRTTLGPLKLNNNSTNDLIDKAPQTSSIDKAVSLDIKHVLIDKNNDSIFDGIMIFPMLKNAENNAVKFTNQNLETIISLLQNNIPIYTKRTTIDNSSVGVPAIRRGIYIPYSALNIDKVSDNILDVEVKIKGAVKYFSAITPKINSEIIEYKEFILAKDSETEQDKSKAQEVVQEFLNYLNTQELKKAHQLSVNNDWRDFENFSSKDLGFGAINKIDISTLKLDSYDKVKDKATIISNYTIHHDSEGEIIMNQKFYVQKIGDSWKIIDAKKL